MRRKVVVLIAAAASAAVLVVTAAQGAYPGHNGRIGFLGGRGGGYGESFHGVWLVSPSGGPPHHIPGTPNELDNFSISPSGKEMVFVATDSRQIEIDTIATGKVHAVVTVPADAVAPVWSPDGSELAYVVAHAITVIGADGRGAHTICHRCGGTLAWSVRGQIAYTGPGRSIWEVPARGGTPRQITTAPSGRTDNQEDWSPDGSTLVFVRGNEATTHLYTVHANGTSLQEFTGIPLNPGTPAYSPDGTEIVFEPVNLGDLWLMGADGSGPHVLRIPGFSPTDPDWQSQPG